MLNAIPMVISKESFGQIFTFAEDNYALAKNLYNAARSLQDGIKRNGQIWNSLYLMN